MSMNSTITDVRPVVGSAGPRPAERPRVARGERRLVEVRGQLGCVLAPVAGAVNLLATWTDRVAMRRLLAEMPRHLRDDLALDEDMIRRECAKPFWRA